MRIGANFSKAKKLKIIELFASMKEAANQPSNVWETELEKAIMSR